MSYYKTQMTRFFTIKKIIINANQELNYVHIGAIMNQIQLLIRIINTIQARMARITHFFLNLSVMSRVIRV